MTPPYRIRLLLPDLPAANHLQPWLERIDATRHYTNFGPLVRELEQTLAQHWPVAGLHQTAAPLHVVTLNTGTAALELAIAALELPADAAVLVPAFSFPASAAAVLRNGLRVVFCDVDADTWQLTPEIARAAARRRKLSLVLPVATFGCPLDVSAWDAFIDDTGIPVLMDAAAAFGNQAIGRRVHVSFSLHATKPFGIGEGGLLVSRDAKLAARVRQRSDFGFGNGQALVLGSNGKLSEYAAAVALAQWARWPQLWQQRSALWQQYRQALADLPGVYLQAGFASAAIPANVVLRLACAGASLAAALAAAGIQTRRWYCPALNHHPAFAACDMDQGQADRPSNVTEGLTTHTLGLPWHHFLQPACISDIVNALMTALVRKSEVKNLLAIEHP